MKDNGVQSTVEPDLRKSEDSGAIPWMSKKQGAWQQGGQPGRQPGGKATYVGYKTYTSCVYMYVYIYIYTYIYIYNYHGLIPLPRSLLCHLDVTLKVFR